MKAMLLEERRWGVTMFGNCLCAVYGPDAPANSCEWCRERIRIERELAALKEGK